MASGAYDKELIIWSMQDYSIVKRYTDGAGVVFDV
jgi:hypothetical protein